MKTQTTDPLPADGRVSHNSGTVEGRISLHVGHWPDRKRPALWLYNHDTNVCHILAWFVSGKAARTFMGAAKKGIVWGGPTTGGAA